MGQHQSNTNNQEESNAQENNTQDDDQQNNSRDDDLQDDSAEDSTATDDVADEDVGEQDPTAGYVPRQYPNQAARANHTLSISPIRDQVFQDLSLDDALRLVEAVDIREGNGAGGELVFWKYREVNPKICESAFTNIIPAHNSTFAGKSENVGHANSYPVLAHMNSGKKLSSRLALVDTFWLLHMGVEPLHSPCGQGGSARPPSENRLSKMRANSFTV